MTKRGTAILAALILAAPLGVAAADKVKVPPKQAPSPRSKEVRDEIASLFPPNAGLPENSALDHDPFRFGYTGTKEELELLKNAKGKSAVLPPLPSEESLGISDAEILKKGVGKLRVGGVFVLNGVVKISVDGSPHREGDIITVNVLGRPVPVLIGHLTPKSVIFMLSDQGEKGPQVALRF